MEFIETSIFTRQLTQLLSDEEYKEFQLELLRNPQKGPVIPKSGGLRKVRVGLGGRGKSGGGRVIYYLVSKTENIYLIYISPKNVRDDLSDIQLKVLRQIVEELDHG
jgi:mRNA-degrading endonuclease RelE of RelBE toxin-antitoxin system